MNDAFTVSRRDDTTAYYHNDGLMGIAAIVRQKPRTQFWLVDRFLAGASHTTEHATRAGAEKKIETELGI